MRNYEIITPENVRNFQEKFSKGLGRLVIIEPGFGSHPIYEGGWQGPIVGFDVRDIEISLYDRPKLGSDGGVSTGRGYKKVRGEDWQTGCENDRMYLLRKMLEPTGDLSWDIAGAGFQKLDLNGYDFKISPGVQLPTSRGPSGDPGLMLFVPRSRSLRYAFISGLNEMIKLLNSNIYSPEKPFTKEDTGALVDYMMKDIEDSRVSEANLNAGIAADEIVF